MGTPLILNDTLQITIEQGFPKELVLEEHRKKPFKIEDFKDKVFSFTKPKSRIYHIPLTRCFLVHNIDGKWLYWGHCLIIEQTIKENTTEGKFKIIKIYNPEYQEQITKNETDEGKSYF